LSLGGFIVQVSKGKENPWAIFVGIFGGVMFGMTGIFSELSIFYIYGLD
tara:strand:- start:240 stop:386 length:147 start_codon:yes stop_codon:yes gene_type:complete